MFTFELVLNTKEADRFEIIKSFLTHDIFNVPMKKAMLNISNGFISSSGLQLMEIVKEAEEPAEDDVRFFHYILVIHLLHKTVNDQLLEARMLTEAEQMLVDCRKKLIILMSKIFVMSQKCKAWQKLLQEDAKKLLTKKELFDDDDDDDEEIITQLKFMDDSTNPDNMVSFHLFCVKNNTRELSIVKL